MTAHGQHEYERARAEAEPWRGQLPAWSELNPGQRSGWDWVEGLLGHDQRPHCFCEIGPRVIRWGDHLNAWAHTDGYACPDSVERPAPDTAKPVLF